MQIKLEKNDLSLEKRYSSWGIINCILSKKLLNKIQLKYYNGLPPHLVHIVFEGPLCSAVFLLLTSALITSLFGEHHLIRRKILLTQIDSF